MSFESKTCYVEVNFGNDKEKTTNNAPENQSSPLMFEDDDDLISQLQRPSTFNQAKSPQNLSAEWMVNAKNQSNAQIPKQLLSFSQIEHVTTCLKCDEMASYINTENHNRTLSGVTERGVKVEDDILELVTGFSPKRARLNEPTMEVDENLLLHHKSTSKDSYAFWKNLIDNQSKVIGEHFAALHKDSAKHLMLVDCINGAADK